MSEKSPVLSIITPTYNRGHLLQRCYESLQQQTEKDFEWIIVDDGSVDSTQEIVAGFCRADFPVVYVKKENGGKHTALNASHPYIRGRYVLILDSDDYLLADAVERVRCGWNKFAEQERIGVVIFLRGDAEDSPLAYAKDEGVPVDILRYKKIRVRSSDCCEVIRTELFLKYPFPVFEGERFVSECALWNRVAQTHKCVYINKVIYICEYLEGGLTQSGRKFRIRNPKGGMFTSNLRMDKKNYFSQRVKYGLLYTCYGFFAGVKPSEMARECCVKVLMWLCLPLGGLLHIYWKNKFGD